MREKAIVEIVGGELDGALFEIDIDPLTNEPPSNFNIDPTGYLLYDASGLNVIGNRTEELDDGTLRSLRS